MRKVANRAAVTAVGVLAAAAGLGLWTTAPAAHAATEAPAAHAATSICVDPGLDNVGDECCNGKGKVVLDVLGVRLICESVDIGELNP
jgi:hypothetical protein